MDRWLEDQPAERNANIGQTKRRMIDHDVAAALGAVAAVAHFAALELAERLFAFRNLDGLRFPQGENAHWRGGITPAILTVAITHIEWIALSFDHYCAAVTGSLVCIRHGSYLVLQRVQVSNILRPRNGALVLDQQFLAQDGNRKVFEVSGNLASKRCVSFDAGNARQQIDALRGAAR